MSEGGAHGYLKTMLVRLREVREAAGISVDQLERRLILGPGWIKRFEDGETAVLSTFQSAPVASSALYGLRLAPCALAPQ
jgi:transcriptional regulator with XRE-family HTH domain